MKQIFFITAIIFITDEWIPLKKVLKSRVPFSESKPFTLECIIYNTWIF